MTHWKYARYFSFVLYVINQTACGLYTPDKDPFTSDSPTATDLMTHQGDYETGIVDHVKCELGQGLMQARPLGLRWLEDWGTTVTQTITVEDQTGVAPGISVISPNRNLLLPFSTANGGNVTLPQSSSVSIGGTASANALRTETIQYTFTNKDLLSYYEPQCLKSIKGAMIDGDLKIREFILDKALVAASQSVSLKGTGPKSYQIPPFNVFTEEITFVAAYGGSFAPTWKLARFTANTSSNLLVGQRTNTNDLIVTLGPIKDSSSKCVLPITSPQPKCGPVILVESAMNQHQARVNAAAIAVAVIGQSH